MLLDSTTAALKLEGVETPAFMALFDAVMAVLPASQATIMRSARTKRLREIADEAHCKVQED